MAIKCCFTESDDIEVYGAASAEEAKAAADVFFRSECDDEGLVLDNGVLSEWGYDEPAPDDWQDHFFFRVVDREPMPAGYYEY